MKRSKPKRMSPPTYLSVALATGCVLQNVLQFGIPEFPAPSCGRDVRWRRTHGRPRRLGYRKKKRGGPKLVFVQYGFCRESKRHYEQSRAGTRIYIGYALESWRQLHLERSCAGLADGCSSPNGRRVTSESYLLILPQVPLTEMNGWRGGVNRPFAWRTLPILNLESIALPWVPGCCGWIFCGWIFAVEFFEVEFFEVELFEVELFAVEYFHVELFAVEYFHVELFAVELFAVEFFAVEFFAVEYFNVEKHSDT